MVKLGSLNLHVVSDGGFRLDGGAMFGVIPRVLWEREKPPDEHHRIRMATNCLLVESGRDLVLIDSGLGGHLDARKREIYTCEEGAERLPQAIQRAGFELGDVTHVLLTHLHFDHCGWNCRQDGDRMVPTFPRARYWISRGEVGHARGPNERDRASYDPRNWEPLFDAGLVELFEEEGSPLAGVTAVRAPGHNADMCIVRLDGGSSAAQGVFWADLIPTVAHVPYPWIMGYDLYPLTTLESKKRWLPQAAAGDWLSVFEHDSDQALGRIVEERPGRFRAAAIDLAEERWLKNAI